MRIRNNLTCKQFVIENKHEIESFINEGKSLLEIYQYYQDIFELNWHDYPTFGVHVRKLGFKYSEEGLKKVALKRAQNFRNTMVNKSPEDKLKTYIKYKTTLESKSPEERRNIRERIQETKAMYSAEKRKSIIDKAITTKTKNKSFNISSEEKFIECFLVNMYDAKKQYRDSRYPYCCDFYIDQLDLFIEVNGHWTHGKHPFDPESDVDCNRLAEIRSKQKYTLSKNGFKRKNSYYIAEKVWTIKDPEKLNCAIKNNLNYLVIYNIDDKNMYNICRWNFNRFHNISIVNMNNSSYLETEEV